jgi:hypothetical protein
MRKTLTQSTKFTPGHVDKTGHCPLLQDPASYENPEADDESAGNGGPEERVQHVHRAGQNPFSSKKIANFIGELFPKSFGPCLIAPIENIPRRTLVYRLGLVHTMYICSGIVIFF